MSGAGGVLEALGTALPTVVFLSNTILEQTFVLPKGNFDFQVVFSAHDCYAIGQIECSSSGRHDNSSALNEMLGVGPRDYREGRGHGADKVGG